MTASAPDRGDFFRAARVEFPPVFGLPAVSSLIPGLLSAERLRVLCRTGHGPAHKKVGRRILFQRESFLDWLEQRETGHADR